MSDLKLKLQALANQQRTTEQLAEARQQNVQLEENVKRLQEESQAKSKVKCCSSRILKLHIFSVPVLHFRMTKI